jgi:hypothetical protein
MASSVFFDLSSYLQGIRLKSVSIGLKSIFFEGVHRLSPVYHPGLSMSNNHLNRDRKAFGLSFLLIFVFIFSHAGASTLSRFELMDGSIIQGQILSYTGGVYAINSDVLGTISLPEEKIRTIKPAQISDPQAKNNIDSKELAPGAKKIDKMQDRMLSDPETVRLIEELQNNPAVQKILQDEELMQAIAEGNLNRVSEDPKIIQLMDDKTVGKIIEKTQ